jgi:hypothetical protein
MSDSSPLVQFSAHPGLQIRAPWPTQLFGFWQRIGVATLLNYGFNEPSPARSATPSYITIDDLLNNLSLAWRYKPGTENGRGSLGRPPLFGLVEKEGSIAIEIVFMGFSPFSSNPSRFSIKI